MDNSLAVLRPYQHEGVKFIRESREGAVLADDPGLGKTLQATAALAEYDRVLVCAPLLAKSTWVGEDADPFKYAGRTVTPLVGRKGANEIGAKEWVFCHYEVLDTWLPWLMMWGPQAVIGDEVHTLRTKKADWAKAFKAICGFKTVQKRVCLTGTPLVNRVMDLWMPLYCAQPTQWETQHDFGVKYADGAYNGFGFCYDGFTEGNELRERLKGVLLRRTRSEVLNELAPVRQLVEVELDDFHRGKYDLAFRGILDVVEHGRQFTAGEDLRRLTACLQIASKGKIDATVEQARSLLPAYKKVVVFTWFRESADKLTGALDAYDIRCFTVTGAEPPKRRVTTAQRFAREPRDAAFIGTYSTAGASINDLGCANVVIFHDLWWVPAAFIQAERRLTREVAKGIFTFVMCAGKTVDEDIARRVLKKAKLSLDVGTGSDPLAVLNVRPDESVLGSLMDDLKRLVAV